MLDPESHPLILSLPYLSSTTYFFISIFVLNGFNCTTKCLLSVQFRHFFINTDIVWIYTELMSPQLQAIKHICGVKNTYFV